MAEAGHAPVPRGMWRGACAPVQRMLFRHFRFLGSGPRVHATQKGGSDRDGEGDGRGARGGH
eukprot:1618170-Karenia_brevis.AAC.1